MDINAAQNRRLGLFHSTVLNMIDMVGIGPFITMPIVIGLLGGMYIWAWVAGALLSFVDAMIWSELGAAYPLAGGSYNFLKVAYGEKGPGKMMSFIRLANDYSGSVGSCICCNWVCTVFYLSGTNAGLATKNGKWYCYNYCYDFALQKN